MKKRVIAGAVALAFATTLPIRAYANPADAAVIVAAITASTAAITAAIAAASTTVMQSLYQIQNLLSANAGKIASQVAEASNNQIQRQLDTEKANKAVDVERATRLPIDPCANASRGLADPNFDRMNPGFTGANGAPFGPRGSGSFRPSTGSSSMDKALAISRNDDFAPPPEVQAVMAQKGACESYASGKVRSQQCSWAGINPSSSAGLPDADIRASTIFDGAQTSADTGKVSLSFNDKQLAAATAYVRNLSAPVQLRDLSKVEAQTDEGRRYLALKDSYQARLDLAMRPIEEWTSNRTKYAATVPILQAMIDGSGAAARYLVKHLPQTAPDWNTKGVSLHQMMYIDAARRYDNPDWVKEIASSSDQLTLQREQLMISAQMASLMTKSLLDTEKTNMLLGAIYQASLNKDFMPELAAQHKRATSTR
jgi:hypothetical protein